MTLPAVTFAELSAGYVCTRTVKVITKHTKIELHTLQTYSQSLLF